MVDMHSLADKLFYNGRRDYTVKEGDIAYLDSSALNRPTTLPAANRIIVIVIVAVALVIGFVFVNNTVFASIRASEQAEQSVRDNLNRQPSISTIPKMVSLINLSDDEIRIAFNDAGYKYYDASGLNDSDELVLFKLPSDMTVEEAALLYPQGISSLNAVQATRLLNGGWRFVADRTEGTSMAVHYVDFTTKDPDVAVRTAIGAEGLDPNSVSDSGVDDSGNTFSTGTLEADGALYQWRVSAVPLADMYSISGMPEDACYVGIRFNK
ncbi:MAG TPA: teichoic acid transporter [Eggerthellaceae bacterium]|nr:teichoic acid transporter [Eggerthellaceae bacterium]